MAYSNDFCNVEQHYDYFFVLDFEATCDSNRNNSLPQVRFF